MTNKIKGFAPKIIITILSLALLIEIPNFSSAVSAWNITGSISIFFYEALRTTTNIAILIIGIIVFYRINQKSTVYTKSNILPVTVLSFVLIANTFGSLYIKSTFRRSEEAYYGWETLGPLQYFFRNLPIIIGDSLITVSFTIAIVVANILFIKSISLKEENDLTV